jgi:hypothetical protein
MFDDAVNVFLRKLMFNILIEIVAMYFSNEKEENKRKKNTKITKKQNHI